MPNRLRRWWRALLKKDELERELDEEVRYHLDRLAEGYMADGMDAGDARLAALREFGGVEQSKQRCREARGVKWLENFWQDLRYGARMLRRKPGFTLIAVLTLALGIGANTAVFSVMNAVLLRPLPYHRADELVMFYFRDARGDEAWFVSSAAYRDLKSRAGVFTDVAAWGNSLWPANLTGDGEPERLQGLQVSSNFFEVLGVAPARGRTFPAEEDLSGDNHRVVVISHELWQRRFGGDPEVIGRRILLNGAAYDVIGVMPADFRFLLRTDVWAPLVAFTHAESGRAGAADLHPLARLKPGASSEQARAEVDNILRPHMSNPNAEMRAHLKPLQAVLTVGEHEMLFVLFAAVCFVLLIACLNVANLLLARASARRGELALRAALGAGRGRLVRQSLAECALLAALGGAGALLLANWGIRFLVGGLPRSAAAKNTHVAMLGLDYRAFGYTIALAFLTTAVFGLLPAVATSRVNLNETLKTGGRGGPQGRGQDRARSSLIVTEVALALVLLIGAGLMTKSFWLLSHVERGFDAAGVMTARIDSAGDGSCRSPQTLAFYRQTLERLSAVPGVQHAGIINSWDYGWRVAVEGRPEVPEEQRPLASRHPVSEGYFGAMGIRLRAGRFFTDRDAEGAPPVAIIDETLARRHFPDENPIGKRLRLRDASREIVGVVGATRAWKNFSFGGDEEFPHVYVPYQQFTCEEEANCWSMALMLRAQSGDVSNLIPIIRREVALVDPNQPVHSFHLLEQSVTELNADRRFSALLLTAFASTAALLAAVGIYGVVAYAIAERTREIGIRMALGATVEGVLGLVMGQGLKLILAGVTLGVVGALAATRLMSGLLYGVQAADPATFAGAGLLLAAVALIACYVPARRAAKVNPVLALRDE